ncbi:MAG: glycosyltransferase family 4 protein [Pirellulales bacterium]|nr:glycosyltransferase family 4 protein [Pirellulales bacterium]
MRVGIVIEHVDPTHGGAEGWTCRFMEYLHRQGCEVHAVAQEISPDGRRLPIVPHRLGRPASLSRRAEAAAEILDALDLDVVHDMGVGYRADFLQPHGGCWTALVEQKRRLAPPWLGALKRRFDPWLPRHRAHELLLRRQCAADQLTLLALSEKIAGEFQRAGFPAERIRVVYNGVDLRRFSPTGREPFRAATRRRLGLGEETVLALMVAHNLRLKGADSLLGALRRLLPRRLPLHVLVVGGRRLRPWRRRARAWGLEGQVTFLESQAKILPLYAAADLLVHPSFYDSCSLVLLEAAACGLPVIATRQNGAAELFTSPDEGLILDDAADVEGLAESLQRLVADAELRRRLGRAARQRMLSHSQQRNFDQIFALYRQRLAYRRAA